MPLAINTRNYMIDSVAASAVTYRDPSSTASMPSAARLARTDPKPTTNFPGVSKTEVKLSKRVVVADKAWPVVFTAGTSVPAGALDADIDLIVADFRSFVASTAFANLVKNGTIYNA